MTLEAFLRTAWDEHADAAQAVAERLPGALDLLQVPADVSPLVRLATHVYGEHLGAWQAGLALLERMGGLPLCAQDPAALLAVQRGQAALRIASGEPGADALATLPVSEHVSVLAQVAAMQTGRENLPAAIQALEAALQAEAKASPEEDASAARPGWRAMAVAGNNLAAALEGQAGRSAAETEAMLRAARIGLTYWRLAGGWLEEERAHYQLARCELAAGQPEAAAASALQCVTICERESAPAFELFFGHAVHALALRAAGDASGHAAARSLALAAHAQLGADEQPWCRREHAELNS
ncbi:hypothetical protein LRH25_13025 [Ideonella azotifigens]|uniref:Tetratricopeptide repeat protein n=1 Tax=Ideonella azotifigens TaxID=513160 RepID=A0ABP3V4Z8_9BURK|nr:hypothetical protein [Ideonella azotifigens]MCD2341265.1 hypothetical protein [Ideonella azotifigens]